MFGLIFKFFVEETMFFGLLHAKSCRTIMKLPQNQFCTRNVPNWTKSLVSCVWFLSPEAGGTLRAVPGEPWRAAASHGPFRVCIRTP